MSKIGQKKRDFGVRPKFESWPCSLTLGTMLIPWASGFLLCRIRGLSGSYHTVNMVAGTHGEVLGQPTKLPSSLPL